MMRSILVMKILFTDMAVSLSSFNFPAAQQQQRRILAEQRQRRTCVIAYHKPANVVTTHAPEDVLGRYNVFQDLLKRSDSLPLDFPKDWHAIGRLDAETTGLLLLTNDGGLVHHATNKNASTAVSKPLEKTYEALIMGYHENDSDMLQIFRTEGVDIGAKYGGRTSPVQRVQVLGHPSHKSTLVSLTIVEGKNRQVRRMFHASGSGVVQLKRTAMGSGLTLEAAAPNEGDWSALSDEQIVSALHWTPRFLLTQPPPRERDDNRQTSSRINRRAAGRLF